MLELYKSYMAGVLSGEIVAGRLTRLAIERQAKDLKRQKSRDFPYKFSEAKASAALAILSIMQHTTGDWKGMPFQVQPFQAFRFAVIFGWIRKDNGKRRFRVVYNEVARKQGKSEEATATGCIGLTFDGEKTPQIYSAATTREQAKVIFKAAKIMMKQLGDLSPLIKSNIKIFRDSIINTSNDGEMKALSSDAQTLDGLNPHFALIDEYHEHTTSDVLEVMSTGMGARSQPLLYVITTAGFNVEGPCYQLRKEAINVLEGKTVDETFFTIIYTLDEGDDWNDESNWIKANPQIGVTPTWEYMRSKYVQAVNQGGRAEVQFKTKNLNIWTRSHTTWIQDEVWMRSGRPFDESELKGRMCFGGLDLATTKDLCALTLEFPPLGDSMIKKGLVRVVVTDDGDRIFEILENGVFREMTEKERGDIMDYRHIYRFYCPKDTAEERSRRDKVDYLRWAADGLMVLTPGDTTDYDYIRRDISEFAAKYRIHSIAYDRYNSSQLVIDLQDDGHRVEPFSQSVPSMNAPTVDLERTVRLGDLAHNGNAAMRWMMGNVMIQLDANGNIKINKAKAAEKVDGPVSAVMARGQYMTYRQEFIDAYSPNLDMISL